MTSLIRDLATKKSINDIVYIGGPSYNDSNANYLLFPFTFKNSTLEINPINEFNIINTGIPISGRDLIVRLHGGQNLVQAIGPNFKEYIFNTTWDDDYTTINKSSITVEIPDVVTRVQQLDNSLESNLPNVFSPSSAFKISDKKPINNYVLNKVSYGVTYAFEKPLIISFKTNVGKKYLTFYTDWIH